MAEGTEEKPGNLSFIGKAWWGWERYQHYAEAVKTEARFVRNQFCEDFLRDVLGSCLSRVTHVPAGELYWRARLGSVDEVVSAEVDDDEGEPVSWVQPMPYPPEGMKPVPHWAEEGRAHPRGIPYLYIATTKETALSEVRPWIGSLVSVAAVRSNCALTLIDCSRHHEQGDYASFFRNPNLSQEDGIWRAIDQAFARPVQNGEVGGEYIPTQIISELFKANGYDGVIYKSLLSKEGRNIAIFNFNKIDIVERYLFKADAVRCDFLPYVSP